MGDFISLLGELLCCTRGKQRKQRKQRKQSKKWTKPAFSFYEDNRDV